MLLLGLNYLAPPMLISFGYTDCVFCKVTLLHNPKVVMYPIKSQVIMGDYHEQGDYYAYNCQTGFATLSCSGHRDLNYDWSKPIDSTAHL